MACFDDKTTDIATLVRPFDASRPYSELENPNSPKVVLDSQMRALLGEYYSTFSLIRNIKNQNPIQARIPFDPNIR